MSGILSSISLILAFFSLFNNFIFTSSITILKSTGKVPNFPVFNLSTLLSKLLQPLGPFLIWSISNLSTLDFKVTKSTTSFDISKPVAFFKSAFVT